jgi:hypothetical protein
LDNTLIHVNRAAIIKPESSQTPKLNTALKPKIDQRTGIIRMITGHLFAVNNKKPKVKILVGQGNPKVGEAGYVCPK